MEIQVEMLAFNEQGTFRKVKISDTTPEEKVLNAVYHYGQNHVQTREICSVSSGDVIHFNGKLFLVAFLGFEELTQEEYETLVALPQRERSFYSKDK